MSNYIMQVDMPIVALLVVLLSQAASLHTTHYPRHGGLFFAAANDTLHIEGVWPLQRVFKLYIYDQESRPLPLDRLRSISGLVVANGVTAPLVLREDDEVFEARISSLPVPGELQLQLRYTRESEPEGFHLIFPTYSDESALTFALEPTVLQDSAAGLLDAIHADLDDAQNLVERQQAGYAFAPAVRVRDRLLALEKFLPAPGTQTRPRAEAAIREAVRVSWLLHTAADEGTVPQIQASLAALRDAMSELADALPRSER